MQSVYYTFLHSTYFLQKLGTLFSSTYISVVIDYIFKKWPVSRVLLKISMHNKTLIDK